MVAALALLVATWSPSELKDYLARPFPEFSVSTKSKTARREDLTVVSQKWQGIDWKHLVSIHRPPVSAFKDAAILYVTGDNVEEKDAPYLKEFAVKAKIPIAAVFDVPNQPIFDAREDALIAITLGKYLETKDPTWPLLFPMTRSAIAAMDAVQKVDPSIKRFIVCGGSKRGWTTWLVGASGDPRVVGIAPMVFDMLGMQRQLAHQKELWGDYSPEIRDYVDSGLTAIAETRDGARLIRMVDPASYLGEITIPTLIVLGGNDPYWAIDAHTLYWDQIRAEHKLIRVIPNVGHNLGDGLEAASSIAVFAHRCLGGGWILKQEVGAEWRAYSPTANFRDAVWGRNAKPGKGAKFEASFYEKREEAAGIRGSFTSTVQIKKL